MKKWLVAALIVGSPVALAASSSPPQLPQGPTSSPSSAIAPVASSTAEAAHVFKAAPGNLYDMAVTTGSIGGYVLVFDATTVPSDGPVTPEKCYPVGPNTLLAVSYAGMPVSFSHGIVAVFSTSGCFNKTGSPSAFFSGAVV